MKRHGPLISGQKPQHQSLSASAAGAGGGELGVICVGGEGSYADPEALAVTRYDAGPGAAYLLRPDGYVAARFRHPTRPMLEAALARASGCN